MSVRGPRYSKEEFVRRGQEIYERDIRPHLEPADEGKFVAIDIETGMYEIDPDDYTAGKRLYARNPDAQPFMVRVGYPATIIIRARIPRWESK
jgi:hypothetical protein